MSNRHEAPDDTISSLEADIRMLEEVLVEGDQAPIDKQPHPDVRSARVASLSIKRGRLAVLLSGDTGYALHPDQGILF